MWKDYDEEAAEPEVPEQTDGSALKTEYIDVIISDVRPKNGLTFSVQILNTEGEWYEPPTFLLAYGLCRDCFSRKAHAGFCSSSQNRCRSSRLHSQKR